jgi:hypothetical protein
MKQNGIHYEKCLNRILVAAFTMMSVISSDREDSGPGIQDRMSMNSVNKITSNGHQQT